MGLLDIEIICVIIKKAFSLPFLLHFDEKLLIHIITKGLFYRISNVTYDQKEIKKINEDCITYYKLIEKGIRVKFNSFIDF